jgi:hypothetical protein
VFTESLVSNTFRDLLTQKSALRVLARPHRVLFVAMAEIAIQRLADGAAPETHHAGVKVVRHASRTIRPRGNRGRPTVIQREANAPTKPVVTPSIIEQYPSATTITVTHERRVVGPLAETLWNDYLANFGPLADLAILRHVDTREGFLAQLANPRIIKIICWVGNEPSALGMVTNSLEDVEEVSPAFLRTKYPELAARDAIFVGMLVMVSQPLRGKTLFSRLYTELWQVPALADGVLIFDVCDFNRNLHNTDKLAAQIASAFPRSEVEVADRQTWYAIRLPEPIPTTRSK